jgi:hypothetical protein
METKDKEGGIFPMFREKRGVEQQEFWIERKSLPQATISSFWPAPQK